MSVGVAVLGSTGSIGRSTLQVLARQRERFRVVALTGHSNKDLLAEQEKEWRPAFVGLVNGGTRETGYGKALNVSWKRQRILMSASSSTGSSEPPVSKRHSPP